MLDNKQWDLFYTSLKIETDKKTALFFNNTLNNYQQIETKTTSSVVTSTAQEEKKDQNIQTLNEKSNEITKNF